MIGLSKLFPLVFLVQQLRLRRRNPSLELDLFVIVLMWVDQFKSFDIVMPRYFSRVTV